MRKTWMVVAAGVVLAAACGRDGERGRGAETGAAAPGAGVAGDTTAPDTNRGTGGMMDSSGRGAGGRTGTTDTMRTRRGAASGAASGGSGGGSGGGAAGGTSPPR